jgi:GMP synthase-like glutamine amidotransferase
MKIHYLQHVHFEGLGYIESWLHENEVTVSSSRAFEYARFPELAEFDGLIVLGGPMSVNKGEPSVSSGACRIRQTSNARMIRRADGSQIG